MKADFVARLAVVTTRLPHLNQSALAPWIKGVNISKL
jgi:hypothetical protein